MNKKIKIVAGLVLLVILAYAAYFYNKNLTGIGPAIKKPPEDITKPQIINNLDLKLPEEFSISVFAKDLNGPRVMLRDPVGNILVSEPSAGDVVALINNQEGIADKKIVVASGLNKPHGLAFNCLEEKCKFYIAETDKVVEYDYDETNLKAINGKKIIDLPNDGGHNTRTLLFMPYPTEDKLLISVGSSCNVCTEKDSRRAKVLVYDTKTKKLTDFATGLRNSVFMTIHPVDGSIWATEMGRDLLGDDIPPDEINILRSGNWYGWPWFYGKNVEDHNFSPNARPSFAKEATPSHIDLQAHSAPLGLSFIPEEGWPEEYWYNLLVAYHGSWNRSVPTGYKIVRIKLDANGKVLGAPEDFITGWLTDKGALGRPVDIMTEPGGKIYISDDKAGVIYLVKRTNYSM